MKKKILTILVMFVMALSVLTGCNAIKLTDNPDTNAPVTSNGGLVAQKGDYLYFVNGYVESDELKNGDNKYNKVTYGNLCRAKTENGALMYDVETDEEGEETKTLKNIEVVVPKIVSSNNGGFYIFDDYIYYASPTTEKDKTGNSRFDLITFFCCNIDGSNTKKLYSVDNYGTDAQFKMINIDKKVYVEIYDGTKITILLVVGNKLQSTNVVSKDSTITSIIIPDIETYYRPNNSLAKADAYIYYTRKVLDSEKYTNCNVLCRASVITAKEEILLADNVNTITLIDYYNGNIYYKASDKDSFSEPYIVYVSDVNTISSNGIRTTDQLSFIDSEDILAVRKADIVGVFVRTDNGIFLVTKEGLTTLSNNGGVNMLKVVGDKLFCYESDTNKLIKITIDQVYNVRYLINDESDAYFEGATKVDICGNYVYYFNTYKGGENTGYYLNRIELDSYFLEVEFLGQFDEAHTVKESDTNE